MAGDSGPGMEEARRRWRASRTTDVLVGLLDAEAGDGPGDDELLDLLGAFEDVHDLGVAVPALDGVLAGVAVAAEDLDGPLGDPHGGAAGVELGLAALGV